MKPYSSLLRNVVVVAELKGKKILNSFTFFEYVLYSHSKPGSHSSQRDDLEDRSNDGWKLHTMRKSRSTLFKTAYGKKGGGSPFPNGADELCVIDKVSLPSSFRQRNGDGTKHLGGELTVQALNYAECGMTSPENGETAVPTEEESMIQEVIQTPSSQDSSNTIIQNVESSTTQLQNNSFSSHVSPKASIGNEGYARKQLVEGEDQRAGQNSSLSDGDNSILPINTAVPNFTGQHQPLQPFLPIQPLPFPALPTHIIAQYLAGLVVQPSIPKENNFPDGCKPPRPPPGLNTEPVPAEEQEYPSPPPRPAGKLASFEKLMERLHKRFPDKSR